jgi:hypothetical protein
MSLSIDEMLVGYLDVLKTPRIVDEDDLRRHAISYLLTLVLLQPALLMQHGDQVISFLKITNIQNQLPNDAGYSISVVTDISGGKRYLSNLVPTILLHCLAFHTKMVQPFLIDTIILCAEMHQLFGLRISKSPDPRWQNTARSLMDEMDSTLWGIIKQVCPRTRSLFLSFRTECKQMHVSLALAACGGSRTADGVRAHSAAHFACGNRLCDRMVQNTPPRALHHAAAYD